MTESQPIYRFLPKKRSDLPQPLPTPAPAPAPTTPAQSGESSQSQIKLEGIDERIDSSVPATKPLSNSGWDVAALLKEWRLDDFT